MDDPFQNDPEIMHGATCFRGTRVPVAALFDLLAHGRTIDYFLTQFPTVRREQILAVLARANNALAGAKAVPAA